MRAQGLGKDRARLGQGLHAHTIGVQVRVVAIVRRGQGSRQARFLVRN